MTIITLHMPLSNAEKSKKIYPVTIIILNLTLFHLSAIKTGNASAIVSVFHKTKTIAI